MRSIDSLDPIPPLGPKIVTGTCTEKPPAPEGISNDAGKMRYLPVAADRLAADIQRQMREAMRKSAIPVAAASSNWFTEYVL